MRKIRVGLGTNSYYINIGIGLLQHVGGLLSSLGFKTRAVIVTNPLVQSLYGEIIAQSLFKANIESVVITVPDGEEYKSLQTATELYVKLAEIKAERQTPLLALGGGVIGDLAGFVAATYQRGMPLIHIPTTLLAQVDSSIGGKVAINHQLIKNKIGSFYQPKTVIIDPSCLQSLPEKEVINGMAEVIKYAVIKDRKFFDFLNLNMIAIKSCDAGLLEYVVHRCATIKANIVSKDERDMGLRMILNFGHTGGHALESASNFKLQHGEAVALGMLLAFKLAVRHNKLPKTEYEMLKQMLLKVGLPVKLPQMDIKKVLEAMQQDKKISNSKFKFILPSRIGRVYITDEINEETVLEVLEQWDAE